MDKLDIERSIAQPGIYLFFMILGQLGTWLTAWLSFEYESKYVYYYMMGMLLLSILGYLHYHAVSEIRNQTLSYQLQTIR